MSHVCEVSEDDDGWLMPACACGWSFGPVPDWETAADCVGDHREAAGRASAFAEVLVIVDQVEHSAVVAEGSLFTCDAIAAAIRKATP